MSQDDSDGPRRRQPSADALAGREAARLVRDLNRRIGQWQGASVKMSAIAQKLNAAGKSDPSIVAEAQALLETVRVDAAQFDALVSEQGSAVAGHTRIRDTRRSIEMVADRLTASLLLLGVKPPTN